jgi:FkbH-like protein
MENNNNNSLSYPFETSYLLRNKRSIRRDLLKRSDLLEKRIAILGGSTTAEVKDMLELFLLKDGVRPVFYEADYNRYYEELMFPNAALEEFRPDIIYIHTSCVNITRFPSVLESEADVEMLLASETDRFRSLWDQAASRYACPIIQNNFEQPHYRGLGSLDGYDIRGRSRFVAELNLRFSLQARERQNLYLNDINYLSAWFGLERWYDKLFWYSYKYAMSYEAIPLLANSVASIIKAIFGKTRKCLVLDLDNTLWGGVIGDDGPNGIQIGKETPEGEAFTEVQQYVGGLKERGIILAICSKNDETNAREGFAHPDSVLALDDFSSFQANWEPKDQNIRTIAQTLSIGLDSMVFADDNPVERQLVRSQEPDVAVPELGNNMNKYIDILDKNGYFEAVSISSEDLQRSSFYANNNIRKGIQATYANYDDFLASLAMKAEIKAFAPPYLARIAQLINKTNQFNVTTRRYTESEIEYFSINGNYITLYGRLIDKYGDNGLVSIMIGEIKSSEMHIDLWVMSCRVLKRGVEEAMFDRLVAIAHSRNLTAIYGYYHPTAKNGIVSGLFSQMGFTSVGQSDCNGTVWRYIVPKKYKSKNLNIEVAYD